eukprot:gene16871-biopygen14360
MADTWHLQELGDVGVSMAGAQLQPKTAIKILGALLDHKLNWEPNSAAMAAKARGVAHRVWRATKGLKGKHVVQIMQAMAHPILDYVQPALTGPSELAQRTMNSAYKQTARLATRARRTKIVREVPKTPAEGQSNDGELEQKEVWILPSTAPILKNIKWATWSRRVESMRASFVFRTWAAGRPAQLARHLPPQPMESMLPAATKEFTEPQTTTYGGREL